MKISVPFHHLEFFLVLIVLAPLVLINLSNHFDLPIYNNIFLEIIGCLLVLAGIIIYLSCSRVFKKIGQGTPFPFKPPKNLVIDGLYKYTRNPMYLGFFIILLGEFLFFGHLMLLIGFLVAILGFHLYVVLFEETGLKKRFGKEYFDYLKEIPRWLPKKS